MTTLQTRLTDLATRVATECKTLRTLINSNQIDLSSLNTTNKTNLVSAINELKGSLDNMSTVIINDSSNTTSVTWSASKISTEITNAINGIINGSASALDTLAELANALGNDANFSTSVTTALSNRLRFDAAQTLTTAQVTQACTNLGIGEPNTDFVTVFNTGLV